MRFHLALLWEKRPDPGDEDPRREAGFTIYYMGINIGAFGAPLLAGWLHETYGFRWAVGNGTKYLGRVALKSGDFAAAEEHFLRSLRIANELGLNRELANLFFEIARLRISQGRTKEAIELIGMIFELPESTQEHLGRSQIRESAEKLLASLEGQISSQTLSESLNRGKAFEPAGVISELLRSPEISNKSKS